MVRPAFISTLLYVISFLFSSYAVSAQNQNTFKFEYELKGKGTQNFKEIAEGEYRGSEHKVNITSKKITQLSGKKQDLAKFFSGKMQNGEFKIDNRVEMTLEGSYLEVETDFELDSFPVDLVKKVIKKKRFLGVIKRKSQQEVLQMLLRPKDAKVPTQPFLEEFVHEKLVNEELKVGMNKNRDFQLDVSDYKCVFSRRRLECNYQFSAKETFTITD